MTSAPHIGESPIDKRTGLFSSSWYLYLRNLGAGAVRSLTGTVGRVKVTSTTTGDTVDLEELPDSGVGAAILRFTRDRWGRVSGTQSATTDNLTEGTTNLYYTDERAQDAIATAIAAGTHVGVAIAYSDGGNSFSFTLTNGNKGDVTVASSGASITVNNAAVTYVKIQNVGANSVLCRANSASGVVGEIALSASQLFGRGATGDLAAITVGSGLTMTGTTLSASGGGGGGSSTSEGTWASVPGSPATGDLYFVTDAPSMARYDGSAWKHRIGTAPVTPPVIGGFTQVNYGTTTDTAFGPFRSIIAQKANAYALRGLVKAVPATPYTVEAGFLLPVTSESNVNGMALFGLGWYDGTKWVLSWFDVPSGLGRIIKMNSATSVSAVYTSTPVTPLPSGLLLLRIREDASNRYVDVDQGGGSWVQIHSVARTDFLTATHVGIAVNIQGSATWMDRMHWVHWKEY